MLEFSSVINLDRDVYRNTIKNVGFFTRSCEYSYANLIAWRNIYSTSFSELCDGYAFLLTYKGEPHYFAPVVSEQMAAQAYRNIVEYAKSQGCATAKFVCLPERHKQLIAQCFDGAYITPDRNKYDYIYEKQKLSEFSGKALHSKRNHKNRFLSLYGEKYFYRSLTAGDVPLCLEFNNSWYSLNSEFDLEEERAATTELLNNFEKLNLLGGGIFIDGKLCAYTLASDSYDDSDTLIIHTEKGLYDYHGIYPTICSEFLKYSPEKYKYSNREDDAGDEGLRKSKLSYKPVFLEKKYYAEIDLQKGY